MKKKYSGFCLAIIVFATLLFSSCVSTTRIESIPPGADVYLNNEHVGTTPYDMSDSKIVLSTTYVRLEMDGYETLQTEICRDEDLDGGAIIGGLFFTPAFLWAMKYYPVHTYELYPLAGQEEIAPMVEKPSSKAEELRELKKLQDEGIITQEEFEAEKKKILDSE